MSPKGQTPQFGGEWMSKISDLLGTADKKLDQSRKFTTKELEELKKSTNTAAYLYAAFETKFKKDLEEDGVHDNEAQKPYLALAKAEWDRMEMGKVSSEILTSPELAKMNEYVSNVENLPKLKELIDNAEPEEKWRTMLMGFASQVPMLGEFMKSGGLDQALIAMGLGKFVKPKKAKEAQPATQAVAAEGKKEDKPADDKEKEDKEKKEVARKTPGSTLFMGDSITDGVTSVGKEFLKINGTVDCIAKVSMSSGWGKEQANEVAATWKDGKVKPPENAVILFGTNDLLGSADTIINNLQDIYRTLYKAGVKRIYAVTIPPHEGYGMFDRKPKTNETRHAVNDWIRGKDSNRAKPKYVHHVMDTCLEEKDGGLATNGNPERLRKTITGDNIHIDKKELAKYYQRELEIGSAEPEKQND
jgi:hypothetical protein